MKKDDNVYIELILDSIRKIESFLEGFNKEKFTKDQKSQSAVILHLTLIGENSKKISEDIKSKIDLQWKEIAGFRDVAIHDYINLKLDVVWDTITKNIPELKSKLLKYKGG
jgi:uncharacterized protein with HEPN domain